ncbi:uncharacterized protein LOC144422207 [Styela clava]
MNTTTTSTYYNTSNTSTSDLQDKKTAIRFRTLMAMLWSCFAITLYLLSMLVVREIFRSIRKKKPTNFSTTASRHTMALRITTISAALFLLSRCSLEIAEVFLQDTEMDKCDVFGKVKFAAVFFHVASVYLFLWIKQRVCYLNPAMKHLTSKLTRIVSWLSFAGICFTLVGGTYFFMGTRTYGKTDVGCNVLSFTVDPKIPWVFYAASSSFFQILLLGLFIFPLIKHRTISNVITNRNRHRQFFLIIRRSLFACVVCVFSDAICAALLLSIKDPYNVVPIGVFIINLQVNLISVVVSFSGWKSIIYPCEWKKNTPISGNTEINNSSFNRA